MEDSWEEFKTDDGVDEYDKDDKEGNVEQGNHRHDDTVQDNL